MRIMSLDIGSKTIGVAVSDELGWTAQGVTTLKRSRVDEDLVALDQLLARYEVNELVVGWPRNMNGTVGPQAERVREVAEKIRERTGLPVHFWDERLSTVAAEKMLLEADLSRAKRRRVIDKTAAVMILQGFLQKRAINQERPD